MKSNQEGFSAVETSLVLVIVALIGGTGWYVWQSRNKATNTSQKNNTTESAQQSPDELKKTESSAELKIDTVDIPSDWKKYTNETYGFSFRYPTDFSVNENKLANSLDKAEYVVQAVKKGANGGYEIRLLATTQQEAVELYEKSLSAKKVTTELVTKNGLKGSKVTSISQQNDPESTTTTSVFFFPIRSGIVLQLFAVYEEDTLNPSNKKESKAFYDSLEIEDRS